MKVKSNLKQRIIAEIAGRMKRFHHFVKGQILVLIRLDRTRVHALEQFPERQIPAQLCAQNNAVQDHADELLCALPVTIGDA